MNEYDSARMADMLDSLGLRKEETPEKADLLILNTCAVREHAEMRVLGNVGQKKFFTSLAAGKI